jgi:hypothetical protein
MTRRALLPASALLIAALVPAVPAAASSKAPVVRSISPKKVRVGHKLTVRGRHFVPGKGKTRVFFVRVKGKGVAVAMARSGSKRKVVVTVPKSLNVVLKGKRARFKLRVLGRSFGKWTRRRLSPVVIASAGGSDGPTRAAADCDRDGTPNGTDTDDDNDLLPDTLEGPDIAHGQIGTDPCSPDTDRDGVSDAYEWQSAIDLNRTVLFGSRPPLPYPGKRPYPNALFPDAGVDYDGDGLNEGQEQVLWNRFGAGRFPLNYSDGLSTTVPTKAPTAVQYQQMDSAGGGPDYHDGWLNDGERDADGDHLTNWDEFNGRMTPGWWEKAYDGKNGPKETPYLVKYSRTDAWDSDTDGDGVPDGLDDQDHDGLSNMYEVERPYNWENELPANSGGYISATHNGDNPWARVQPFDPCKPVFSKTCNQHPPFGYYEDDEDWFGMWPADAIAQYGPPGAVPGPIFAP